MEMTFCSAAVVSNASTNAFNSLGLMVKLERKQEAKTAESDNEIADLTGDVVENILVNGVSKITETDIMATNGVMHVLDTVLETETGMPFSSILESRNLTVLKALIEAGNFEEELDSLTNVTFFAPTDKAFEGTHWKQALTEDPDSLKNNEELNAFLKYHIAKPLTKTRDLEETMIDSEAGEPLRVNLYSTVIIFAHFLGSMTYFYFLAIRFHQCDEPRYCKLCPPGTL